MQNIHVDFTFTSTVDNYAYGKNIFNATSRENEFIFYCTYCCNSYNLQTPQRHIHNFPIAASLESDGASTTFGVVRLSARNIEFRSRLPVPRCFHLYSSGQGRVLALFAILEVA